MIGFIRGVMQLQATIYGDDNSDITVTAKHIPFSRGVTDHNGIRIQPDTDERISVLDAIDQDGNTRILSRSELGRAESAFLDLLQANQ